MTAKTRGYYVNLGKEDAQAGNARSDKFGATSWQRSAYDNGYDFYLMDVAKQAAQEAQAAAQGKPAAKPEEDKSPYLRSLQSELKALRRKHGFKYLGGDVCQWHTMRLLKPQVVKRLAKLEGLIRMATRGYQYSRFSRELQVRQSGRSFRHSMAFHRKDGQYGPSTLAD